MKRKELLKAVAGATALAALSYLTKAEAVPPAPSLTISKHSLKGAYDVKVELDVNEAIAVDKDGEILSRSTLDHSNVIQKAIDHVESTGGKVVLGSGKFTIKSTISKPAEVIVEGMGCVEESLEKATILHAPDLAGAVFLVDGGGKGHGAIRRLTIKGGNVSGSIGIHVKNITWMKIEDVELRYFETGIKGEKVYGCIVNKCFIYSALKYCIWYGKDEAGNNSTGLILTNSELAPGNGAYALYIDKSYNNFISNNWFESYASSDLGCMYINNARGTKIINNKIGGFHGHGINLLSSPGSLIAGNVIRYLYDGDGIVIQSGYVTVVGNVIEEILNGNGILLGGSAHYCTVVGNVVRECGKNGINSSGTNSVIACNSVWNNSKLTPNGYDGIRLGITASRTVVSYNIVGDNQDTPTQRYGIYEFSGADYNVIEGNTVIGNVTGKYYITGAHTYCDEHLYTSLPTDGFAVSGKPVYYYDGTSYYLAVWDESALVWRKVALT